MNSLMDELEAMALGLPRSERARLAERLLSSLDEDATVDQAWAAEGRRRLEQYRAGKLEAVSAASVHEEARRRLAR
jgi:putative addiction module component (TIGR02574 family)